MKLRDPFAYPTPAGGSVADLLFAPLAAQGGELTIVDAGARNGMIISPEFARRSRLIGFEPNPEEYEKLAAHRTDAGAAGVPIASFAKEEYHNCALWSREEERSFYITAGTGACTLMGETVGELTRRMWMDGKDRPYADLHTQVRRSLPMRCRPLDDVLGDEARVDYMKLDVEGAEAAILEGSEKLFARRAVLFIKTEFVFTPYYKVHPVLGYQHVYLHERGFRLIDLDLAQPRYSRDRTSIPALADRRLIYAGDAYFMLDPERGEVPSRDLYRMGLVAVSQGFHALGVSLIRDSGVVGGKELGAAEVGLSRVPLGRRLKELWGRLPLAVARGLARLRS
ncbi:MAG: FkbM family methyltransferase [Betaproteobacteria bacterium]